MTTDITLSTPNLMTVKDCRAIINYYARVHLSLINISALHSDLSALANNLNTVDQNANDVLLKLKSVIDTADIEEALLDLGTVEGTVLDAYKRDLNSTLTDRKKELTALRDELYKPTFNLKNMSYTSNVFRLQELAGTRANLQAISKIEKEEDHYDVMLEKKHALDMAIKAYEEESFYDKTLPILNQIDKVVTATESPATFKKELLKEGVAAAKTILKLADSAVKHNDMVNGRVELIKLINERNTRNNEIDRQLKDNFEEARQLRQYEKLRDPKAQYVAEVENIYKSIDAFIAGVFAGSDPEQIAKRLVEQTPALKAYASNLYPLWLRT